MTKQQFSIRRTAAFGWPVLALLALALCALASVASAQSGRRAPKPAATPAPEATPQAESESESKPRATKPSDVIVSFVVVEQDTAMLNLDFGAKQAVIDAFMQRLGQPRAVSVSRGGKGGRREARERAKKERDVFVVLFEMEEERAAMGEASIGRVDSRTLLLKTYVYAPESGDLKYTDTIMQRPYRPTTTIGGVRVPVPSRRVEQYPSQLQLEQAARDAADRLMSRFGVIPPPEN
ncbi:MAG TPA: hypothetical protein VEX60_10095 [Pyrinomonadaceae bacterium]|nr:hypothetical protein [Pyrinomonadaceae bacterium]